MLCTASSHFVLDLCRRPFYGCARRLLFVHKETPGTRLEYLGNLVRFSIYKGWNFPFMLGDILNIPLKGSI